MYHFRVAVVLVSGGSSERLAADYVRAAFEFGRQAARRGWTLRTGGGRGTSIMGAATDGALSGGGRAEGVILRKFWAVRHRRLRSLRVCGTFARRKAGLFRGADAAVFFPGGYGTLDELGDILALKQNGFTDVPVLLVNVRGYFDPLVAWFRRAGREGFLYGGRPFEVVGTPLAAARRLASLLARPAGR